MGDTKLFIWEFYDDQNVHKAYFSMAKSIDEARENFKKKFNGGYSNVISKEPSTIIANGECFGWDIGGQFT